MNNTLIAGIEPNTKPRMTTSDKWKKRPCVLQYRAFCDHLRLLAKVAKFELSPSYKIEFLISMPPSWSKKKKNEMRGKPHQETPDLDNLLKAINDALLAEDKTIHEIHARKIWADKGQIIITNL
jgi:Holliday junction resolvase RusA-like endonuclease